MTNILSGHDLIDSLEISDDALAEVSLILKMRCDFSMSSYKDKCMKRRVAIRMRSCRCLDAAEYCNLLRQNEQELDLLKKALTIHVSHFFRNPSMFEKLRISVIPHIFQNANTSQNQIRFWSLGCAGGEEAYSLGILLQEFFTRELIHKPVEICAADIDADILLAAAHAEYNEDRLKELPVPLRESYFIPKGAQLQLSSKIRRMVTFCHQNIMDVRSFEPCQLVLCRNTLIYFTRTEQEKILCGIAHILPADGILVLGKSETLVGNARALFAAVCPVERIYRRI
ncbi:MAG: protein-glutamate O-methyltransferase CheR [Geobacteraceae bacterium]|nr:protein-glutamate O-methyltransferase CheR [Geobacteraceae bacterium]NTW79913.1 protein-glutamate O-methyltransferase CheR [Geobacteraceae bacterium]